MSVEEVLQSALSITFDVPREAQDVLDFWFAGDQTVNYKSKWFPEGSSAHQAAIDCEIATTFHTVFTQAMNEELGHWRSSLMGTVALIVVLDQFSRHVFRHRELPADHELRRKADSLALDIATTLHQSQSLAMLSLPVAQFVFSLMPLRHSPNVDRLQFVLLRLSDKESSQEKAQELLERFRKQTIRRLQHLQDRAKLEATDDILERQAFQTDEKDILKHPLVRTTEAFLKKHLLHDQQSQQHLSNSLKHRKFNKQQQQQHKANKTPKTSTATNDETTAPSSTEASADEDEVKNVVLISLSGGVDSMVLSKILAVLRDAQRLPLHAVVAMHVDYNNRPESGREAEYVQQWSDSLGIVCNVRKILEANRGVTERDAYEKITREIRYGFYQQTRAAALSGQFTSSSPQESPVSTVSAAVNVSGVIFGHHLGDVQENVISNVMRGSSPLDLSGMTETSQANGVFVWRPLLSHVKEEIYDFAHTYGVPYFKDSTPSWSTRGKLRNQLVPLLVEIYGEGCLRNLSNLAAESDQNFALVRDNLYAPFLNSVQRHACGLRVNVEPFRRQPQCFWREVLKQLMHSMSMSMVRDKAVANFVERLQKRVASRNGDNALQPMHQLCGWLELRKGFHSFLTSEGELQIIRDGVLRQSLVVYNPATTRNQMLQSATVNPKSISFQSTSTAGDDSSSVAGSRSWKVRARDCEQLSTIEMRCNGLESTGPVLSNRMELETAEFSMAIGASESLQENEVAVGCWAVSILAHAVCSNDDQATANVLAQPMHKKERIYRSIDSILDGVVRYSVFVPTEESVITLVVLKQAVELVQTRSAGAFSILQNNIFQEEVSPLSESIMMLGFDLRAMDLRIRDGLPIFVPVVHRDGDEVLAASTAVRRVDVQLRYVGPTSFSDAH